MAALLAALPAAASAQDAGPGANPSDHAPSPFGSLDAVRPGGDVQPEPVPAFVGKSPPADVGQDVPRATETPSPPPVDAAPPKPPAADQSAPPLTADEAATFKAKARAALLTGDVASARAFLTAVVTQGDPEAAYLLARTYDAQVLSRWGTIGVQADPEQASRLYERARRNGYVPTSADVEPATTPPPRR